jgi:Flp pilus assembly protein TadG
MTGFVAIVAIALVMVAGMAYDGGQVIKAHGAARNYAHQAARAGAQEIDLGHLRSTGEPQLDPRAAESAALNYLRRVGVEGSVSVSDGSITVTVTTVQPMHILPGPDRVITVTETAAAIDEVQP